MNESIYDKAKNYLNLFHKMISVYRNRDQTNLSEFLVWVNVDIIQIASVFDEFEEHNSKTYRKYLEEYRIDYINLFSTIEKYVISAEDYFSAHVKLNKLISSNTTQYDPELAYKILLYKHVKYIINHLNLLLDDEEKVENRIGESTFEKIKNRYLTLFQIYHNILHNNFYNSNEYRILDNMDTIEIGLEFDQFKRENQERYKYYLDEYLRNYTWLINQIELNIVSNAQMAERQLVIAECVRAGTKLGDVKYVYDYMFYRCIGRIVAILRDLLNPENEIQEQPKPITPPKGQTVLTREQTALLFWYLREKSFIAPRVTNQNLATAIDLMTGFKKKQIAEILKMPDTDVSKLGKDEDKVTQNDFRIIISQLKMLIVRIENDLKTNQDIKE